MPPAGSWFLLAVLAAAVAPAKAIYLPVILLCLAIPAEHLDPRRGAETPTVSLRGLPVRPGRLVQLGILLLAAVLWMAANLSELAYAARDMNRAVLAAGVWRWWCWRRCSAPSTCGSAAPPRHGAGLSGAWRLRWCCWGQAASSPSPAWAAGLPPISC